MRLLHQTVYPASTPAGGGGVLHYLMADDAEIRLENFRKLWPDWSPSVAATRLGRTTSFWSDLWHGRKSFGEKLARGIEEQMDLVRLSLDDPDGPKPLPLSSEMLEHLQRIPAEDRRKAENLLRLHFGMDLLTETRRPFQAPEKLELQRAA